VRADHLIATTFTGVPPVIVTPAVTSVILGQVYIYDMNATGFPVPRYALLESPFSMNIDSVSGVVEWTPVAIGSFPVTVEARNSAGADIQSFTIEVGVVPQITSTPLLDGAVGRLYSHDVEATGSPVPTFSLLTAPSGMTIDSSTGVIQWTPTAEGSFNVAVAADNVVGSDTQNYSITVLLLPDIPTLIGPAHQAVTADGTPTFIWSSTAGSGGVYALQYSGDSDFTTGVVEVPGLADTTFTVADVDSLADGVWFWRVQATDLLARVSGFQEPPNELTVDRSPPPVPVLITPAFQATISDNTPTLYWQDFNESRLYHNDSSGRRRLLLACQSSQ
jgi:hypothetical protein